MKTKIKLFVTLLCVCSLFAFSSAKGDKGVNDAKMWAGIAYLAATQGPPAMDPGPAFAYGVIATCHSTMWGAVAAAAFCTPVGIAVSIGVGV